jgi:F-type H+-transporting ATPase subunit b
MSIDWVTLGIQAVNVVVLVWLLRRFFWRPVAAMIAERRAASEAILAEAEAKRTQASAALAEIERTRAGFAAEREAVLAAARASAEQAAARRLEEAGTEAAARQAASTAELTRETAAAHKVLSERASRLAVEIAGRLAGRLEGPLVRAAFLQWLLVQLRALPEATRRAMASAPEPLEALSATPLEPAEQERCRELIGVALGAEVRLAFVVEPALVAGLELRGPHLVVRNSWRADLAHILQDLTNEPRS